MKIIFSIIALVLMTKECDQNKVDKQSTKTEVQNNQEIAKHQEQDYTIKYSAMTRGTFKEVTIDNSTISIKKDRTSEPKTQSCNSDFWKEILVNIDSIDLESLQKLEAPTGKRLFDGAAHATLKIMVDDKTYSTSSFDHGFPPEEIQAICDMMMKLLE